MDKTPTNQIRKEVRMKTVHAAKNKWRGILSQYIESSYLDGKHKPCPLCGGKDRFRFLDREGSGSWVCNQCTPKPRNGIDLIIEYTGKTFGEVASEVDEMLGNIKPDKPKKPYDATRRIEKISSGVKRDIRLTPVWKYLRSRGINIIPQNIGYHESIDYWEDGKNLGKFHAMVARIQNKEGERTSFHITYLDEKGNKAKLRNQKKILSAYGEGSGVYLGKILNRVIVGEGIETTLAAMQAFDLPGVAAMSAGNMERIQLPEIVTSVLIIADADKSFVGQSAAFNLARRLANDGIDVEVEIPPMGQDYADVCAD